MDVTSHRNGETGGGSSNLWFLQARTRRVLIASDTLVPPFNAATAVALAVQRILFDSHLILTDVLPLVALLSATADRAPAIFRHSPSLLLDVTCVFF